MNDLGFWTLVPPLIAIGLAIRTKQVVFSLTTGIFIGYVILNSGNPFTGFLATIESFVQVFQSFGNTRTVVLTLLIGALIQLIRFSGGINGFVRWTQKKLADRKNFKGKLQALSAMTGFLIFIESNISILTVGTIFRPLFDRFNIPREKLAYLADSSSAPSCILFPLNAWGAYIMGLLAVYEGVNPFTTLVYAIPFNFYAITTLLFVFWVAWSGRDFGEMKRLSQQKEELIQEDDLKTVSSPVNMIIPILVMVVSMPFFLVHSGWDPAFSGSFSEKIWNSINEGSGSQSVLNACFLAFAVAAIMYFVQKRLTLQSFMDESFKGMNEMLVMALLMVLAFSLGNLCNELGTGIYVSGVTKSWLLPELAPSLIFVISSFIAFSTGTSWGTFAIMISIGIPLSQAVDANIYLMVAAVLGGGVFGDHCSPISDTTLIASVAAKCDHIDHVRTQLPYALFTGGISIILYLIAGWLF